jgi:hypothetical protein
VAHELGARAKRWVEHESTWDRVAARYADFLDAVKHDREWIQEEDEEIVEPSPPVPAAPPRAPEPVSISYIASWAEPAARDYVDTHQTRLEETLAITPPGTAENAFWRWARICRSRPDCAPGLGYGMVRGCY